MLTNYVYKDGEEICIEEGVSVPPYANQKAIDALEILVKDEWFITEMSEGYSWSAYSFMNEILDSGRKELTLERSEDGW